MVRVVFIILRRYSTSGTMVPGSIEFERVPSGEIDENELRILCIYNNISKTKRLKTTSGRSSFTV